MSNAPSPGTRCIYCSAGPSRPLADETTARVNRIPLLLAVSSLGAILAPLNSTMLAVALPDIRDEFSLSHGAVAWLISGYLIAMAVAQPIGGRLGDHIG